MVRLKDARERKRKSILLFKKFSFARIIKKFVFFFLLLNFVLEKLKRDVTYQSFVVNFIAGTLFSKEKSILQYRFVALHRPCNVVLVTETAQCLLFCERKE